MTDPIVSYLGVESGNLISHKRFLALFAGGMLPLISLSFLHMLVKFEEEEKKKKPSPAVELDIDELSKQAGRQEAEIINEKYTPTEEDLEKLETVLGVMLKQQEETPEQEIVVEEVDENDPTKINRLTYTKS
jgi:hypothetical protein